MRKLSMLKTLPLVIGTLLPVLAHANCGGAVGDNSQDCLNRFGLILAWGSVPRIEDEIAESDAAAAQSAYLEAEKDPPGKTEAWSNPTTHHWGR
jgi:hypothetical protein